MLNSIPGINEYDAILFTPNEDNIDQVEVRAVEYKNKGDDVGESTMGKFYDIIIFRLNDEEDRVEDLDKFSAILTDPSTYVSRMMSENWFGLVAKKTTTSDPFVDDIFAKWSAI
jgi:hypothetical protein